MEPTGGFVIIDAFNVLSDGLFGTACSFKFGCAFSDVVAAVASIDPVMGGVDR